MIYDICIVGSGQSGLTTCKTFIEKGYNIIILEKNSNNGLFSNIKEKDYFHWSSSRYISGFSDFPINKKIPEWFTIKQYSDYLNSYKKRFNLDKFIQYNSNVINCIQNEKEEWIIEYILNKKIKSYLICKKLIICSGLNQVPKFPEIINNFTGEIIHTDQVYINMKKVDWYNKFTNKKVLLIGGGESAFDIGHIITNYTNKLYYSTKNYIEWFYQGNEPDNIKNRKNKIYEKIKQKKEEDITTNEKCFIKSFINRNISNMSLPTDTQLSYSEYSLPEPISELWHNLGRLLLFSRSKDCSKCIHSNKKLCSINDTPENLFNKYVVKRTDFIYDLFEEKVKVVYYPIKIDGRNIYTKDGIINNVDIIVCATGYRKEFLFLDKKIYTNGFIKKIIPKNTKNIAFIGFARPTMGSISNIAEIQSWWTELYFNNKLNYKIRKPIFRKNDVLNLENENIDTLVIGCFYMKDLAKDMNIEPNMLYLFFYDFELFKKIYTGTCHPMIYRIHGQKSYLQSRYILMNTLPDFDKDNNIKIYLYMFVIYHIIFIIICIIIGFIITYLFRTIMRMNNKYFYYHSIIISFIIIYIFYIYFT